MVRARGVGVVVVARGVGRDGLGDEEVGSRSSGFNRFEGDCAATTILVQLVEFVIALVDVCSLLLVEGDQRYMHMVKPGIWQGERICGRDCVPVHFHALALDANAVCKVTPFPSDQFAPVHCACHTVEHAVSFPNS